MPTSNQANLPPYSNRRRSQRALFALSVTVRVEGSTPEASFTEETKTLIVNAHGALITLSGRVEKGQTIYLTNRVVREEQQCRVTYVGSVTDGKAQVGFEFNKPSPKFWPITFPPEDWAIQETNSIDSK